METGVLENKVLMDLVELLKRDGHLVRVIPSSLDDLAAVANFDDYMKQFTESSGYGENHEMMILLLKNTVDYLRSPIVVDNFDAVDIARNKWEQQVSGGDKNKIALLKKNKLSGGAIGSVLQSAEYFKNEMWFSDLMSDYNLLLEKYYNKNKNTELNSYNAMTNEEKIEFAREVSKFAKDLYRKLVSQIALNSPSAQN